MKIGFIGIGIMGKPMCKNLLKAGHQLTVCGHKAKAPLKELVAAGAKAVGTPREVAKASELIITMLPNSPQVKEVVIGKNGVIEGAKRGTVVVDMSSITPLAAREIAAKLAARGVEMLDAPVSGGEPRAINGTLSVMVGGKKKVFDRCEPVLKAMASSVVLTGDIGAGNVTKLANQIIAGISIAALGEAFVLAAKAGVEPELVYQAIRGGLAGSNLMEAKIPLVMDRKFTPGFKLNLHIKDLTNVLETSHDLGVPLPLTASVLEMMHALKLDDLGECDHSALIRYYEKMAKVEVKRKH